ncbi:hypothetical protein [Methylosinus sp. PW1]|nr:hypothetical protein [Methylosinus sp. PW1]
MAKSEAKVLSCGVRSHSRHVHDADILPRLNAEEAGVAGKLST